MLYVIPENNGSTDQLEDMAKRAGVTVISIANLYEMWPVYKQKPHIIVRMPVSQINILMRYHSNLLDELGTVIMNAPGTSYRSEWMLAASSLPSVDWLVVEQELSRSGLLAASPSQAEERSPVTQVGHKTADSEPSNLGMRNQQRNTINPNSIKPSLSSEEILDQDDELGDGDEL